MFCTNCGKEINNEAKFCTNCGNKLISSNKTQEQVQSTFNSENDSYAYNSHPNANNIVAHENADEYAHKAQNEKSSDVGIKMFLVFIGCLFLILIVLLSVLFIPIVKNIDYERNSNNTSIEVERPTEAKENLVEEYDNSGNEEVEEVVSKYTLVEDSSQGMIYKIPSEFDKDILDNGCVYYYFNEGPLGFIMINTNSEINTNVLSDTVWNSFIEGVAETEGYSKFGADKYIKIDGEDGRIHNFNLEIGGVVHTSAIAGFIKDGTFYSLGIIAENYYFDDYYPVFEDVLKSIKVE